MGKYVKEELEKLIFEDCLTYDAIGSKYGVTGAAIRKAAKNLGIELPKRRDINPSENFNKGVKRTVKYCLNCGKEIPNINKYCDNSCKSAFEQKQYIERWKNGSESGGIKGFQVSMYVRNYLFDKHNNQCEICKWGEINKISNSIPLEIHHIDGDVLNNKEENLQLLCPNCHSLTENYGALNKNSTRK